MSGLDANGGSEIRRLTRTSIYDQRGRDSHVSRITRHSSPLGLLRYSGSLADPLLGDLDAIQCRAFEYLIAADEEIDGVFVADVRSDPADEDVVLSCGFYRHGEVICSDIVDKFDAGEVAQRI